MVVEQNVTVIAETRSVWEGLHMLVAKTTVC